MKVRFTRSARKHRIGKRHVLFVIENYEPQYFQKDEQAQIFWIAKDDRGLELEIVALEAGEHLIVIHVMPTSYIRRNRK